MISTLSDFYERDINKLTEEINSFKNEGNIWRLKDGISNPAGNLVLHLIGNLNYFIGTILAKNGYVREREKEFSEKNISRSQLILDLQQIIPLIQNTLPNLSEEQLQSEFPVPLGGKTYNTEDMLVLLLAHLNYHLGQVNYLRRILEAED
jgi:uncharacterized damage-inducible protein DinB